MKFIIYYGMQLTSEQKQEIAQDCAVDINKFVTGSFKNDKGYETPVFFSDKKSADGQPHKACFKLNLTKAFSDLGEKAPTLKSDSSYAYAHATINFKKSSQRHVVEQFTSQEQMFDEDGKLLYTKGKITSPLVIEKGAMVIQITGKQTSKEGYEYYLFKVLAFRGSLQIQNIAVTQNESSVNEDEAPESLKRIFS